MVSPPASRQPSTAAAGPALVCAAAGAILFQFLGNANRGYVDTASLFYWWGFQWFNPQSESEHGILILALSVGLAWRNLRAAPPEGAPGRRRSFFDWVPALAIGGAVALHAVGFAAQQARISIVALLLFTWGVLRLAGGPRWGRAAVFPLGFLLFAIPIDALDPAAFWLRLWVANASVRLAHAAGIAVLQAGTQLQAPDGHYQYDVVAACSGVRSLVALFALSVLLGYLNFRSGWRRLLVSFSCFPLVYLGNVLRITVIIFAAQWAGPKAGDWAHALMGWAVFALVLGGVLAGASALRRLAPESVPPDSGREGPAPGLAASPEEIDPNSPDRGPGTQWRVAVTVVVLASAAGFFLRHLSERPGRGGVGVAVASDGQNPVELPAFIGTEWIARRAEVTAVEREVLPPDTGYSRKLYVALGDPRQTVLVSIVLSGRDRTSIHRPELCLVGQGWTITGAEMGGFNYPGHPQSPVPATFLRVRREVPSPRGPVSVPQLVAYWFVNADSIAASSGERLLRDAWNRVRHARADRWAYVLLQTDAGDGEAKARARMQEILDATLPVFQRPLERD